MKAVVCERPGQIRLVERPTPHRTDDEVLIRIWRVGLCGTDFHIYEGRHPFLAYPRVMGHELSGEVVDAPRGSPFRPGQIVSINPYLACGACVACRKRKPNACVNISVLGVHADGGMCELLSVPKGAVVDATGLTLDQAAMIEFLAIGAHAVDRSTIRPGDSVLVAGAGPIGIAAALFARLDGADVTLVDRRETRLAYARDQLGFDNVVLAGPELSAALIERTKGDLFDIVFDATGSLEAMAESLNHCAHGGTLVLVGVAPGDLVFPDPEFHKRETTLVASRNAVKADFERVIGAIRDGKIPLGALHTHSFRIEEISARLPELMASADHVLKAIGTF